MDYRARLSYDIPGLVTYKNVYEPYYQPGHPECDYSRSRNLHPYRDIQSPHQCHRWPGEEIMDHRTVFDLTFTFLHRRKTGMVIRTTLGEQ